MCIVADSVNDVSKTKIASFHVAYTLDNGKTIIPSQLVVYAANVDSATNTNAFILPIYNPGNNHHKIIPLDFSKLPDFFTDIKNIYNRWFPDPAREAFGMRNGWVAQSNSLLDVHRVGDYKFSIMPSKIDFNRLDRSQLNISHSARTAIDVHSNDYSFIIYQFYKKGQIEVTPFAYLCEPLREHAMIVPTIHGHPHNDNRLPVGIGYITNIHVSYNSDFEDQAEYDHEIYTLIKNPSSTEAKKDDLNDMNNLLKSIKSDYMHRKIRIYSPRSFIPNKITINGYKKNRNLIIKSDEFSFLHDLINVPTNPTPSYIY